MISKPKPSECIGISLLIGIIVFTGFLAYTASWAHGQNESQPFGGQAAFGVFAWEHDTQPWSNQPPEKDIVIDRPYTEEAAPTGWLNRLKEYIKPSTPAVKPSKETPTQKASCEGISWTVPDGVRSVKVRIKNSNGSLKNSYNITDYIKMKPSERVELIPTC